MGDGQQGLTLRSMEAICYNKYLLTDNASVKNLKFYQTGYIHYSKDIEEADLSFLSSDSTIDYGYEGNFSPLHLIEHIDEIIKRMSLPK